MDGAAETACTRRNQKRVDKRKIADLTTGEGWVYMAIGMDLYSRRIVGSHLSKRRTSDPMCNAMLMVWR